MKRAVVITLIVIALAAVSVNVFSQAKKADKAIDPVCGLPVDKNPELSYPYKGQVFYFCSVRDLNTFKQAPEKYVKKR